MSLRRTLVLALAFAVARSGPAFSAPPTTDRPHPPEPPAAGPGSDATTFPSAETAEIKNPLRDDLAVHLFWPSGLPAGTKAPERLPVVLFLHGFGATDALPYDEWLRHIAREGTLVVYPVYPGLEMSKVPRYDAAWEGFLAGLRWFDKGPIRPDTARVGFVGHSFGGGAAPAMAARAAARGMGRTAMWIESLAPWYDLDRTAWAVLPPNAVFLSIGFCDDVICDTGIAESFVREAATIPAERKRLVVFHTDDHGSPPLRANHYTPLTMLEVDDFDRRGTWRLDDALRTFSLTGDEGSRAIAFGLEKDPAPLGTWSDGTPVARPEFGTAPTAKPSRLKWYAGGTRELAGRMFAQDEAWSSLPLPAPEVVPASRLPRSERLVRMPPTAAWPDDVAAAAKAGRVLVIVSKGPSATKAALDAAVPALEKRGIKVFRAEPDSPLGEVVKPVGPTALLHPLRDPSVLLLEKGGEIVLWKEGEQPYLVPAIEDLTK